MKVLQINSVCGKSSTGRIASDLASELNKEGGHSIICYGRDYAVGSSRLYSYKIGSCYNNYFHLLLVRLFDFEEGASIIATKRLCRYIKRYDPDIIHLHNIHGYYLNYRLLFNFLKKINKPIVWTLHDCWPFTGHCSHFENVNCYRWEKKCGACPQTKRYPHSLFFDNSSYHFDLKKKLFTGIPNLAIVTPSEWLKKYVKQSFLREYDVFVINNGIDRSHFHDNIDTSSIINKYNLKKAKIVLGVSSLWDKGKGLDDFCSLASLLPSDYVIVLIGVDAKSKDKIPSNIISIERTNNVDELAAWYNAAYVFVNPTYEDNFPTVNIEAISCGTPVIGYETGGSVESIKASGGIVVKQGDVQTLAEEIINSHFGIEQRLRCVETSKQYDSSIMHRKYLQLYKNIIKDRDEENLNSLSMCN